MGAIFWANVRGGRYSITEVHPEGWDPPRYYDANPAQFKVPAQRQARRRREA